jgi:arsenical pump membrane protein
MLARPRNIPEVYWVGAGALLLVLLRLIPLRLAGKAIASGSDVYLFLTGMMLLSELARENGVFDWLAGWSTRHANGSCSRLFLLVYAVGTAVTIALSNDATAIVLTPAILTAVKRAKVQPLPYLFACAMVANAASFTLPISNPANLVVFHNGLPPLGHWLASFLLPSLLSIATTFAVLRWYFRNDLCGQIESESRPVQLDPNGKLVLAGLGFVFAVLLVCSAYKQDLGLPTCLAALAITAAVCIKSRTNPWPMAKEISWTTLALVAALFILVNAVESIGALRVTTAALHWAGQLPHTAAAPLVALTVGIANNLVNNLPLGLIAGATLQAAHTKGLLANAILIGVDLGPNLSVTGSLATILWLIALRKEKLNVSAWDFLKAGALAMPAALLLSVAGQLAMQAVLPQR